MTAPDGPRFRTFLGAPPGRRAPRLQCDSRDSESESDTSDAGRTVTLPRLPSPEHAGPDRWRARASVTVVPLIRWHNGPGSVNQGQPAAESLSESPRPAVPKASAKLPSCQVALLLQRAPGCDAPGFSY